MNLELERQRSRLALYAERHGGELPTGVLLALSEAIDELQDPIELPTETEHDAGPDLGWEMVVSQVRTELTALISTLEIREGMAAARAVRILSGLLPVEKSEQP